MICFLRTIDSQKFTCSGQRFTPVHSHAGYMSFSVRPSRATGDRSPSTVTASLRDRA